MVGRRVKGGEVGWLEEEFIEGVGRGKGEWLR